VVQSAITYNEGIYTPAEVALFAKLHPSTLCRWFYGNNMGRPVMPHENAGEKVLTFLDLVQAIAVRTIRHEYRVPLPKIREAVERAQRHYKLTNIFARPHCTVLFSGDIFIYPEGGVAPVQVSGKQPNQMGLKTVVELYQRDLSFDENGLAKLYSAFRYANAVVLMDPAVRFGEPYVEGCGYSARTLRDAVLSEGGVTEAAKAFGVSEEAVEVAYRYYDSLELAA
jgi:uncharacterized protein (DUF433 family)